MSLRKVTHEVHGTNFIESRDFNPRYMKVEVDGPLQKGFLMKVLLNMLQFGMALQTRQTHSRKHSCASESDFGGLMPISLWVPYSGKIW